jgi:hypothetical protein
VAWGITPITLKILLTFCRSISETRRGAWPVFDILTNGQVIMKRSPFFRTIAVLIGLSIGGMTSPVSAATAGYTVTETVDYEVVVTDDGATGDWQTPTPAIAVYGPFHVISPQVVELRGVSDSSTPGQFRRMIAAYPGLTTIEMVECPGSEDDDANLALARMIRRAGLNTHVPKDGSIRSGGVELFLAGVKRTSEPGAQFGVHSWIDSDGREARDYAASDPVHQQYVGYYEEMGFKPDTARAFYTFTNAAAPASGVHYMTGGELAAYHLTN